MRSEYSAQREIKEGRANQEVDRIAAIRERVEAGRKASRIKILMITAIPVIAIAAAIIYGVMS